MNAGHGHSSSSRALLRRVWLLRAWFPKVPLLCKTYLETSTSKI